MKVAFCVLAATLAVGASAAEPAGSRAVAPAPLYGITYTNFGGDLTRFDPATLRRVGRRVRLPQDAPLWAFSPDRRQLALATERDGLQLVDLQRMRVRARLRGGRLVLGLAWPSARRVILAEHGGTVIVDPVGPRVRRHDTLGGEVVGVAQAAAGLVLLARDGAGIGPTRLDLVAPLGRVRSVVLERIVSGWDGGDNNQGPFRGQQPGLAVDRAGNRAFVVGGDGMIAEVSLATLAVAYREPRSLQARAKAAEGPQRTAAWLDGRLAISGADRTVRSRDGELVTTSRPYGLRVFDPATGTQRTLDSKATWVTVGGGLLLAYGTLWVRGTARLADGLALLLAPPSSIGPARLAVARADGRLRTVALTRTRVGSRRLAGDDYRMAVRTPGLAVDPAGRVFVVGADEPVAEVDLQTLRVTYHALDPVRTMQASTKAVEGPYRVAAWLGDGRLAVTGWNRRAIRSDPAGAHLIDTRSWQRRTLAANAQTFAATAGGLVVRFRRGWPSSGRTGSSASGCRGGWAGCRR